MIFSRTNACWPLHSITTGDGCIFIYDDFESCKQVKYASQGCGSIQILKFMEDQMTSYSSTSPHLPAQDDVPSLSEAKRFVATLLGRICTRGRSLKLLL
ncbi:proteasome subunit beta type-1-like [Tripterygium wilfordii]|uniref:proteasome subunit beta type-1-like n=1 Tax=Tripterygium wilfordii TaxID=458696 RepID=UPI0018F849E0|nr:proteasome subunit beta type-1-like [Tripterygium wilfordii]XP_038681924.1 proteasome subunit beta type-1-like [Tripterygium wilfordii]